MPAVMYSTFARLQYPAATIDFYSSYLDVISLEVIDGLMVLLSHIAAGRAPHKVLTSATQAIAEAGLPYCVVVRPLTATLL